MVKKQQIRSVKGMNDVLPMESQRWVKLENAFRDHTRKYGFKEVRTPIVEPTQLFCRSIGEATDIVEKEMYTFVDKGEDRLTLRPEGTASAVRAYLQHRYDKNEPVSKWIYLGPMFRRERPAKGRYRQFHQAGAEVYGDPGPFVDAELIQMLTSFLESIGIKNIVVLINSLGSSETRSRFREALTQFFEPYREKMSEDSKRRLKTNPLRILDSKAPIDKEICEEAPQILSFLTKEDKTHFEELQQSLNAMGVKYEVDPRLVRGLDYYTRTLFEIQGQGDSLGAQNAICGGGRYDNLVEELGGTSTPAIGFALGLERLLMMLPEQSSEENLDAFLVCASKEATVETMRLATKMRSQGFEVEMDLRGNSVKSQLRRADKLSAKYAIFIGKDELESGEVNVKGLRNGKVENVPLLNFVDEFRALLKSS